VDLGLGLRAGTFASERDLEVDLLAGLALAVGVADLDAQQVAVPLVDVLLVLPGHGRHEFGLDPALELGLELALVVRRRLELDETPGGLDLGLLERSRLGQQRLGLPGLGPGPHPSALVPILPDDEVCSTGRSVGAIDRLDLDLAWPDLVDRILPVVDVVDARLVGQLVALGRERDVGAGELVLGTLVHERDFLGLDHRVVARDFESRLVGFRLTVDDTHQRELGAFEQILSH
jgi:hypothetical protein